MNEVSYPTHLSRRNDKLTLGLIFASCFVLFLSIAMLGRMAGLHWQEWLPGAEQKGSMFAGVHAAVYTVMSHLI